MPITFPPDARRTCRAIAPSAASGLVGLQHAHAVERARAAAAAQHGDRARRLHGVQEVVPVGALALERAEQRARPGGARIGDDALDAGGRIAAEQARSRQRACGERDHTQELLRHAAIVERLDHAVDVLALLVSLAEDEDEIAGLGVGQRAADRAAPVVLDVRVARARESADDLRDDALGRLGARVVARHVEPVRPGLGRRAHQRPLGVVAVAAGAEHAQQAPAGERPRRASTAAMPPGVCA